MIGWVYAMEPHDYQLGCSRARRKARSPRRARSCSTSSAARTATTSTARAAAPCCAISTVRPVQIAGGETVIADETYIRESILHPRAKIVEGFQPVMPTFEGQLTEEQVIALIAYIKALGPQPGRSSLRVRALLRRTTVTQRALPDRAPLRSPERKPESADDAQQSKITARRTPNYLNEERGILFVAAHHRPQTDRHSLYASVTVFFFIGGFFALLMRLEL